jgi:hypothetical protein
MVEELINTAVQLGIVLVICAVAWLAAPSWLMHGLANAAPYPVLAFL